ncbi:hypothetical protein [Streptomyces sp. yara]|uniref:hypothetical protein n=1 Tax=Streptomyces sp. yara TaxID=3458421 RepID=UPI00404023FE
MPGAALVGAGLVRATHTEPGEAPEEVLADVASDRAGLVTSEGPVRVGLYLDYLCPECPITEKALARGGHRPGR